MRFIGSPDWFGHKIIGWGLRPKTWQGWLYMAILVTAIIAAANAPLLWGVRIGLVAAAIAAAAVDTILIMSELEKRGENR